MSDKGTTRTPKKAALGRGLGSLLGGGSYDKEADATPTAPVPKAMPSVPVATEIKKETPAPVPVAARIPPEARIWQIDIDKIAANADQPRKIFESESLKSLSASIKEKGILQPIVVRKRDENSFEIIAGERRWRAAQMAGLHRVPVILKNTDDQNALELALIENIQRKDLNVIEEAEAYKFLLEEYALTQQELANRVGKDRASVANILRLLNLATEVRAMVVSEEISLGQAKVLLSLQDPKTQKKVALKVRNDRLTVRGTEKLVAKFKENPEWESQEGMNKSSSAENLAKDLGEEMQKMLGTKVSIDYSNGKGKISVHFYSDDELNEVVERLRRSCQK